MDKINQLKGLSGKRLTVAIDHEIGNPEIVDDGLRSLGAILNIKTEEFLKVKNLIISNDDSNMIRHTSNNT